MEYFLGNLYTAIAAGVLSLFVIVFPYYYYTTCKTKKLMPPEAKGAWPILGHLHMFSGSSQELLHVTLGAMADKYGPAFTIRLGLHRVLVVSSWELAKEIFTIHDVNVSSRPKFKAAEHLGYNYAMFGFMPYGPYWQKLRKIASLELLSLKRLELLKHVRVSEIETSISELYKFCKENDSSKVSVEMKKWFGDLNLNVILRMVVGKRYNFGGGACDDEKEARRCQKIFRDLFYFLGVSVPADAFPFLGWLDIGGKEKAMKETAKEMDVLAEEWLKEHHLKKENLNSSGDDGHEQDFMDVLISFLKGSEITDFYDDDTVVKSACLSLISGGTDTTNVMLTWILSLLMNNFHVINKAQEELDTQVGKERRVNESDINNLVYLQAIIKEALRLCPAGPLGGQREFTADCTIGSGTYHVPKGTRLLVNVWKLQRDPNVWSEPNEFRPERFLNGTHKEFDVKGHHFELIPFGAGRRICPGTVFGLQMLHLVLANLLQCFELTTLNNEPIDMTESAGLTNSKATPLNILISPRLHPSLY